LAALRCHSIKPDAAYFTVAAACLKKVSAIKLAAARFCFPVSAVALLGSATKGKTNEVGTATCKARVRGKHCKHRGGWQLAKVEEFVEAERDVRARGEAVSHRGGGGNSRHIAIRKKKKKKVQLF